MFKPINLPSEFLESTFNKAYINNNQEQHFSFILNERLRFK